MHFGLASALVLLNLLDEAKAATAERGARNLSPLIAQDGFCARATFTFSSRAFDPVGPDQKVGWNLPRLLTADLDDVAFLQG